MERDCHAPPIDRRVYNPVGRRRRRGRSRLAKTECLRSNDNLLGTLKRGVISMAGVLFTAVTPTEIALTGATAKTVILLKNAANHRAKILGYHVSFDGTSGTAEPAVVQLIHCQTDGTMSSGTPEKVNLNDVETIQTAMLHTATVEPGTQTILKQHEVHPQGGYEWNAP